jgi:hypothetical protein
MGSVGAALGTLVVIFLKLFMYLLWGLMVFGFLYVVLSYPKKRRKRRRTYRKAAELEARGGAEPVKYPLKPCREVEQAFYYYVMSALSGYQKEQCRSKLRELWKTHGPFAASWREYLHKCEEYYLEKTGCRCGGNKTVMLHLFVQKALGVNPKKIDIDHTTPNEFFTQSASRGVAA